jgi:hypothetical protein
MWLRWAALGLAAVVMMGLLLRDRTRAWTGGASGWDRLGLARGDDPEFPAGGASGRW